jgi:hypothetical protein
MDLNLSISQQFDIERFNRAIDDSENIDEIRGIAKQLLMAWQTQRAATNWIMKSSLSAPSVIVPPIPENESN